MIEQLEDHFIICGYGRVGRRAAEEFAASGQPFVVLDTSDDAIEIAQERGVLYPQGQRLRRRRPAARRDRPRARPARLGRLGRGEPLHHALGALAAARPDDRRARLDARGRAQAACSPGADRVVQPYSSAGTEMAKLALKPQVAAFLELVSSHAGPDLRFEEIEVAADCPQAGRTIRELRIRSTTGAVVIALRKPDGTFDVTPNPDVTIEAGDVLIAIGTEPELKALEDLFAPEGLGS